MGKTYFITEGKVKTDLERTADELRYAIEEGYPDEDILALAGNVESSINLLRTRLKEVV
jgi:hypothetical protein